MHKTTSIRYRALSAMLRAIKVNKMLDKKGDELDAFPGAMDFVPEAKAVRQEYFKAIGNTTKEIYVHEYGDPSDPLIVLLAPMLLSGEDIYNIVSPHLKGKYFIIAPDQGGHGNAGRYVSAESEYRELKKYLISKGYTDIKLLYGASLGVAIAYRLLGNKDFNIEKVWFDGVALNKNAAFAESFMKNLFRRRKKMLAKTHAEASPNLVKTYGYDFAKKMTSNFARITLYDIDNICYACCHYDLRPFSADQQKRLHLEYGSKDFDLRLSKKAIRKYLPDTATVIRDGYPHCGYMAAHTAEYVEEMEKWIGTGRKNMDLRFGDVQETLIIPLIGRKVCSDHFPEFFTDPEADRILSMLDCDLGGKLRKMETAPGLFGALEVAQRQCDLGCEVRDYLKDHPEAAVVNVGCGLDDTFRKCDNGTCKGYNIDMPDVIEVRNALLPAGERELNIAHDLNDFAWMDMIDASGGAVFYASGVFYYFRRSDIQKLFASMSERFPGAVLVFDCCNSLGARMMTKTWIKEAGIRDVKALFSLEDASEILSWKGKFKSVTLRSD